MKQLLARTHNISSSPKTRSTVATSLPSTSGQTGAALLPCKRTTSIASIPTSSDVPAPGSLKGYNAWHKLSIQTNSLAHCPPIVPRPYRCYICGMGSSLKRCLRELPIPHKKKIMKIATHNTPIEQHKALQPLQQLPSPIMLLILVLLLLFVIVVAVSFGSTPIPLSTIAQILLNGTHLFHFARSWDPSAELIIWQVRMPAVIGAALVGAALAVAGVLFQGMLRNPLADPFLIGTSSGAALGAAIAFILPFDTVYGSFFSLTPLLAFVGAML